MNEKTTAWVVKKDDQNVVAFSAAMHAPGLRLSLGSAAGAISCARATTSVFSIDGKVIARTGAAASGPL